MKTITFVMELSSIQRIVTGGWMRRVAKLVHSVPSLFITTLAKVAGVEFTSRIFYTFSSGPCTPCVCVWSFFARYVCSHQTEKQMGYRFDEILGTIRGGRPNKHARRVRRRVEWEFRFVPRTGGSGERSLNERTSPGDILLAICGAYYVRRQVVAVAVAVRLDFEKQLGRKWTNIKRRTPNSHTHSDDVGRKKTITEKEKNHPECRARGGLATEWNFTLSASRLFSSYWHCVLARTSTRITRFDAYNFILSIYFLQNGKQFVYCLGPGFQPSCHAQDNPSNKNVDKCFST